MNVVGFILAAGIAVSGYVDSFIGTSGMGHCFPGACVPFGGVLEFEMSSRPRKKSAPITSDLPYSLSGEII